MRGYIHWWQMPVNPVVGENGGLIVTFTAGDLAIIAATTAVEALGPAMQGITRGFPRFSVLAARATAETVTIYRGVGQTINGITPNPAYRAALEGRAIPRGWPKGVDNPAAHVGGATENSIYTSWTLERSVALDYATENGNGVILSRTIPRSELGPIWQNYNEAEILIRGPVTGATPTRVRGF